MLHSDLESGSIFQFSLNIQFLQLNVIKMLTVQ